MMIDATIIRPGAMLPHPCPSCDCPTLHERKGRAQCLASCGWTGDLPVNILVLNSYDFLDF